MPPKFIFNTRDPYFQNGQLDIHQLFEKVNENTLPIVITIANVNGDKSYKTIMDEMSDSVKAHYLHSTAKGIHKKSRFIEAAIIFDNGTMIKFNSRSCYILYGPDNEADEQQIRQNLTPYKKKAKGSQFEINLITNNPYGLDLKPVKINKTKLDLDKYYNDDFLEIDQLLQDRLNRKNDKGIVLLHGEPGTGKTTYLRYLIGKLKKKILVLPSNMAGSIVNPEFIDILISNPNSVLIIEDTEDIIKDRQNGDGGVVSNLLNISDGLLADCLNTQLICTFNCPVSKIDPALLRKGRLIARYEFEKLVLEKSIALAKELDLTDDIQKPMTVADIIHYKDKSFDANRGQSIIGFTAGGKKE